MKTRKTFEGQKPKRFEGHLVIECPECQTDNYISLAEAMTEGFIIVCPECESILKPELVSKVKVFYEADRKKRQAARQAKQAPPPPPVPVFHPPTKQENTKEFEEVQEVLDANDKQSSITSAKIMTENSFNNAIIPSHDYMDNSKFAKPKDLEITVLTDHQMSVIKDAVKVLRKYGYEHNAASQLAGNCMRENRDELGIDMRRLVELCLKKEGANLNEQ